MSASGQGWELYVDGNVIVGEFTSATAFETDVAEIQEQFMALVQRPEVISTDDVEEAIDWAKE
jgi:hypothetical protein